MTDELKNMDSKKTYQGPERREGEDESRRNQPDPRKGIRFDTTGGDRRSGFARRNNDEGLHDTDFED